MNISYRIRISYRIVSYRIVSVHAMRTFILDVNARTTLTGVGVPCTRLHFSYHTVCAYNRARVFRSSIMAFSVNTTIVLLAVIKCRPAEDLMVYNAIIGVHLSRVDQCEILIQRRRIIV